MENKEKLVAKYRRVSSDEQRERGLSLDVQDRVLDEYIKSKGWIAYKGYCDAGFSAKSIEGRKSFQEMIADAKQNKFTAVIVTKLDRAFRNMRDAVNTLEDLNKLKIDFISIGENIDTTTAMGEAIFGFISVFAQLERKLTSERVNQILLDKFNRGLFVGKAPTGYEWSKLKKTFVINQKKALMIKDIFKLTLEKVSYRDICAKYKIKPQIYYDIISNPAYIGFVKYKGQIKKGSHQLIILPSDFFLINEDCKYLFERE